jgi:phosphoglycolate phosphatase
MKPAMPAPTPDDLHAALFDLDGTLVRTFIDFARMRDEMRTLSARSGTEAATAGEDDILGMIARMSAAVGEPAGEALRREAYDRLEALEREGCAGAEPVAGARELLNALRNEKRVLVAIITRNCRSVARDLVRRFDLPHDLLIAREDTVRFKPDPEPLLRALNVFGVAPENAVMVGDLWPDIAAGRACGVARYHRHPVAARSARPLHALPADVEVASLEEAAAVLLPGF